MNSRIAVSALTLGLLVSGCGLQRIEPPFRVDLRPALGVGGRPTSCAGSIARAHSALATAASSPGDIAAAHASHAIAMHEYHGCLAGVATPTP